MNLKHKKDGFPPIADHHARILILGSMPGEISLKKQQYYGHERNAFWPIMGALFGADPALDYQQRKEFLVNKGIAVWDVLKTCSRQGSLDSAIVPDSIQINNFPRFFSRHPLINRVFFNGTAAEKIYYKQVKPFLPDCWNAIHYQRLPSTSPAHASLNPEQKLEAWKVVRL